VAIFIPDLDETATRKFASGLEQAQWFASRHVVRYANVGDSVDDSCVILTATHTSCAPTVEPIQLIMPPKLEIKPLGAYIHDPFNFSQYAVCYGRYDPAFRMHARWSAVILSSPKPSLAQLYELRIFYVELEDLAQLQQGLWFCIHLVSAHRLSGARIRTSFNTFLVLSFTMTDTLMSIPSCRTSLPGVSISLIIFSTGYLMLITSLL
jgi:hypothetical protein